MLATSVVLPYLQFFIYDFLVIKSYYYKKNTLWSYTVDQKSHFFAPPVQLSKKILSGRNLFYFGYQVPLFSIFSHVLEFINYYFFVYWV